MFSRLLLTAILATTLASAQRGGAGGGDTGGDMGGGMGGSGGRGGDTGGMNGMGDGMGMNTRPHKQSKLEMFADRLKLSKEQKPEVESILQDGAKEAAPLRSQLLQGREALVSAVLAGKTGADLDEVVKGYSVLEAKMTVIEAKTFSKVCAMLKPNQQAKAASAFEFLDGVFDVAPPTGGGRRGRDR